jgi:RNA polymerase sigma-70 factor (ECF subfamily)
VSEPDGNLDSDARLVEEARGGSREAFGRLVQRYERRLMKVVSRFVRDPDLVEDIAQETFLKAYRRLDQFDASRRFGPWILRIGVNQVYDTLRRKRRRNWLRLFSDSSSDHSPDPADKVPHNRELHEEVRRVLDGLPKTYRTILILRDLESFSTAEVAAILQRRESTVRWKLAEARRRFQQAWEVRERHTSGVPGSLVNQKQSSSDLSAIVPPSSSSRS